MKKQPDDRGDVISPSLTEDVFLTDAFLIKGRLVNKSKRLSSQLEDLNRSFLHIEDATMVSLRGSEVISTPTVMVNINEVICAHELLDAAGDDGLRRLAGQNKTSRIRAFFNGAVQFEVAGIVEPGAYEQHFSGRDFFIMQHPVLRGIDIDHPEMAFLRGLDYVIVRRDKMAYVYDFH